MKFALRTLAVAALVHAGLCGASAPVSTEHIATRNGVVRVTGPSYHRNFLAIDGKRVFAGPDDVMELWRTYQVGGSDAVLFSSDCSGSTCGQRHFYFLLMKRGRKPLVVTTPDFFTADGAFDLASGQAKIAIELGFENGLRKWAELKGMRVSIHRAPSNARISLEDCDRIHRMALDGCSSEYASEGRCDFGPPSRSVAEMGLLRGLANAPGFDSAALGATCHAQCTTGVQSPFDVFRREVCGIK